MHVEGGEDGCFEGERRVPRGWGMRLHRRGVME